jgi:hypothetical protein
MPDSWEGPRPGKSDGAPSWYGTDTGGKYEKAMSKLGIDLGMLSSDAGHA